MLTVGKPKAMRYAIATNRLFGGVDGKKAGLERNGRMKIVEQKYRHARCGKLIGIGIRRCGDKHRL